MAAVCAGNLAASAADAGLPLEFWIDDAVPLQTVRGFADRRERQSHRVLHGAESLFLQIIVQPRFQIVNDAVAVLHDGGRDLNGARAQEQEFQRVAPRLHAAHAADVHPLKRRILPKLRDKPERDRLHGGAAVAAHGGLPFYSGTGNIGVKVHAHNALDGIDGRDAVGASSLRSFRRRTHAVHIGREFREDGNRRPTSGGGGKAFH